MRVRSRLFELSDIMGIVVLVCLAGFTVFCGWYCVRSSHEREAFADECARRNGVTVANAVADGWVCVREAP